MARKNYSEDFRRGAVGLYESPDDHRAVLAHPHTSQMD